MTTEKAQELYELVKDKLTDCESFRDLCVRWPGLHFMPDSVLDGIKKYMDEHKDILDGVTCQSYSLILFFKVNGLLTFKPYVREWKSVLKGEQTLAYVLSNNAFLSVEDGYFTASYWSDEDPGGLHVYPTELRMAELDEDQIDRSWAVLMVYWALSQINVDTDGVILFGTDKVNAYDVLDSLWPNRKYVETGVPEDNDTMFNLLSVEHEISSNCAEQFNVVYTEEMQRTTLGDIPLRVIILDSAILVCTTELGDGVVACRYPTDIVEMNDSVELCITFMVKTALSFMDVKLDVDRIDIGASDSGYGVFTCKDLKLETDIECAVIYDKKYLQ